MKVVLDASAALAAVLGQDSGPAVLDVLADAAVVIAPELFSAEVTSGLWKYVVAKQLTLDVAAERLDAVLKLVDRYHPVAAIAQEVLREASARHHSSYDLCYAILARREGAAVVTIDGRLRKLIATMGLPVYP
ncbi:MAG TPA: type II toxin-antitoxin system VapC family toxin [Thermoanaerobaculia bacterium]|jgi:predicted nucleic acid-binding protein|nr:type II toxin-antitoxin system VapC family toxin [Thermoanaerobaculia bacterium]